MRIEGLLLADYFPHVGAISVLPEKHDMEIIDLKDINPPTGGT